jgi:hypothetical protein
LTWDNSFPFSLFFLVGGGAGERGDQYPSSLLFWAPEAPSFTINCRSGKWKLLARSSKIWQLSRFASETPSSRRIFVFDLAHSRENSQNYAILEVFKEVRMNAHRVGLKTTSQ